MKNLRKIITTLLTVFLFTALFSACTPANRESLPGTYVLIEQSTNYDDERGYIDEMEGTDIVSYIVLTDTDFAYYITKESDGTFSCKQLKSTYNENDDGKINIIDFTDGVYDGISFSLYVNKSGLSDMFLVRDLPHIAKVNYTTHVKYQRIDKTQDLSVVNKNVNTNLSYIPYEKNPFYGVHALFYNNTESPYVYYFIDIDGYSDKATVYYALTPDTKEEPLQGVVKEVTYSLRLNKTDDNNLGELVIDGISYHIGFNNYLSRTVQTGESEIFLSLSRYKSADIEQLIRQQTDIYNNQN